MTTAPAAGKKRRLGEILQDAGLITELQLKTALSEQRKWGGKLGRTLVEMGFVDEASMAAALSQQMGLPLVDLDGMKISPDVTAWLKVEVAERYGVFPLGGDARQKTLQVATSDPTNVEALQELAFHTGMRIQASICASSAIDRAIRAHYYGERVTASDAATPSLLGLEEQSFDAQQLGAGTEDAPLLASSARAGVDPYSMSSPGAGAQLALEQKVKDLAARLEAMERHATTQVKALRGLFEVLVDKGLISREEYLARVRKE